MSHIRTAGRLCWASGKPAEARTALVISSLANSSAVSARQLEWSTSTIFRIETGRSRPQPGNVKVLLELYGVIGPERDGLIRLAREARQPGWWHSFRDILPNPYEAYIGLAAGAASIRNFEPVVVPGLLQTEEYARQTFRNGPLELDRDEIGRRVQVRMERQRVLTREDRPRLWAVLDEAVIRRAVGGPEVMREQLGHLTECAGKDRSWHYPATTGGPSYIRSKASNRPQLPGPRPQDTTAGRQGRPRMGPVHGSCLRIFRHGMVANKRI